MIYSDFENNWLRLELLSNTAYSFYKLTKDNPHRSSPVIKNGNISFSLANYENIENEKAIVSILLAWSEITIDSLINNIIAENTSDRRTAIEYIENPKRQNQILKLANKPKSDLSCKLIILFGDEVTQKISDISDTMAFIRNQIVHDKPLDVFTGEEDYIIDVLSSKAQLEIHNKYDDLLPIFAEFDIVLEFLLKRSYGDLSLSKQMDQQGSASFATALELGGYGRQTNSGTLLYKLSKS